LFSSLNVGRSIRPDAVTVTVVAKTALEVLALALAPISIEKAGSSLLLPSRVGLRSTFHPACLKSVRPADFAFRMPRNGMRKVLCTEGTFGDFLPWGGEGLIKF
jgi:hypothetical protein